METIEKTEHRGAPTAVLLPPWSGVARGSVPPDPPTTLVGRAAEVAAVAALLRRPDVRLVTLTGAAGVGKTRIALRVATSLAGEVADGVAFVPLAAIRNPALVLPAIAAVLGFRESSGLSVGDGLAAALAGPPRLLILDNCEHLLAAAPRLSSCWPAARR
jgi:predicted ATPase